MTAAATSPFSAAPSAAGYLFQCRYALLLLLRHSRADADAQIAIEKFDDISFESHGTPTELIQTKHHLDNAPSLSDGSTDLWKTLRVWSEAVLSGAITPATTTLTLITCATAPEGSAAALLRDGEKRDAETAHKCLIAAAERGKGDELKSARAAFLGLSDTARRALVKSIHVLDRSANIVELQAQVRAEFRWTVRQEHTTAFQERLEGWWFAQVIERLAGKIARPISAVELGQFINDLRESFSADRLPIDFLQAVPGDLHQADPRMFVRQLRLIRLGDLSIRWARIDYYRAYSQRSRWVTDNLLALRQLDDYDSLLVEELERARDRLAEGEPADPAQSGKRLYDHCTENCRPIRPNCTEPYVGRGSYHMLADRQRIGWHPDYKRLLDEEEATK